MAENAWQGDIAIVLSVSGETPPTLELAAKLKKSGCEIIAITSDIQSPLSNMADFQLCYFMKQTRIEEMINITTQIPVIYIIESLSKAVMEHGKTA
ncbi:SIS domain-containing protein [Erwinia sp. V71]|uniref:SIS domain-containing protein n=1 Tax=Erwinia sp. V71 TaxID=3369424 RepID=UPI003F646C42